jgi:hypothetical protein
VSALVRAFLVAGRAGGEAGELARFHAAVGALEDIIMDPAFKEGLEAVSGTGVGWRRLGRA